jgi:hypothetical protein
MYWLIVTVLVLAVYAALKLHALVKAQLVLVEFLQTQFKDLRETAAKNEPPSLPYGWFDGGWPRLKHDDNERAPLENPKLAAVHDEFATQMWIVRYRALPEPMQRVEFLSSLWQSSVWMREAFLDVIYADENPLVRAWAAGHLNTDFKDYTDVHNPIETRNYEAALLADPEPIVGASLWSNPRCRQLPFSMWGAGKDWPTRFRTMTQLERLGLMRNPELSSRFILDLLQTPTEELNITREEHATVVRASALNPGIINGSRLHARDYWMVEGDVNPPAEEYGKLWDACIDKWTDEFGVPYSFFSHVQTTPKKKLEIYTRLLSNHDKTQAGLREAIIKGSDPMKDKEVLKAAWTDPNERCRLVAKERVGVYTKYVGVEAD